ncbi:MAG: hypothetical protein RL095_194 [Verrucomicrobiota bacterium]|jgi:signal transduction histidine kinase/CheY-like chemotaxis protein
MPSLKRNLFLPLIVLALLCALVGYFSTRVLVRQQIDDMTVLRGRTLVNGIAFAAESAPSMPAFSRYLQSISGERDIDDLLVVSGNPLRVTFSTNPAWAGKTLAELPDPEHTREDIERCLKTNAIVYDLEHDGGTLIDFTAPVRLPFRHDLGRFESGAVMIHIKSDAIHQALAKSSLAISAISLFCVTVILFAALYLVHRFILRPAQLIVASIHERRQNSEARAPVIVRDEIGEVAENLNQMLDQIGTQEEAIFLAQRKAEEGQMNSEIKASLMRELVTERAFEERLKRAFSHLANAVPFGTDDRMALYLCNEERQISPSYLPSGLEAEDEMDLAMAAGAALRLEESRPVERWTGIPIIAAPGGRPIGVLVHAWKSHAELLAEVVEMFALAIKNELTTRELINARFEAENASRSKGEFLANMSHEIRTPMNGVLGFSNLLLETPLNEEQKDYVNTLRNSAEALLAIINDILDFSKIEAGKMDLEMIPLDPRGALHDVAELLLPMCEKKEIALLVDIAPEVPASLLGDPGRYRQILLNLISNAIKFTARGSVRLRLRRVEDRLRCEVSDSGIGIAEEKIPKLFSAFEQADASTTRKFGGTGLGLAICKRLVQLMNGEIGCTSEPGRGSTFFFEVPLQEATPPEAAKSLSAFWFDLRLACPEEAELLSRALSELGARPARDDSPPSMVLSFVEGPLEALPASTGGLRLYVCSPRNRPERQALESCGIRAVISRPLVKASALLDAVFGRPAEERPILMATPGKNHCTVRPNVKVLLAEDNAVNQKLAVKVLNMIGCSVDVAANGSEALQMLDRFHYPLVFMDCLMPEMDGYEATRQVRLREVASGRHQVVIALTANAMQGDDEKCRLAGMDDYLTKPLRRDELIRILVKWLPGFEAESSMA